MNEIQTINFEDVDLVVVGSGLFGLTIARLAADLGYRVCVLEKRSHIGGNAYSYMDQNSNIEIHKYGSHLFHTSNERVWNFVNRFSKFNSYVHHVYTKYQDKIYSLPINLGTLTSFYGRSLSPEEAKKLIQDEIKRVDLVTVENLEDKAISLIGKPLYEAFFRGYTKKQWQVDPKVLPSDIITRLPVRFNFNNRYFSDTWEGLPEVGYSKWLESMANSDFIKIYTNIDFFDIRDDIPVTIATIYTGPLDKFFNYSFGALTWRTLDFELKSIDVEDFQGTSVMNYADESVEFTRVHEFKHLHPEREYEKLKKTVIAYEFSRFAEKNDEPYYPVNLESDQIKLQAYRELTKRKPGIFFGGRLGSYKYLDMHMAIASAMTKWENEILPFMQNKK